MIKKNQHKTRDSFNSQYAPKYVAYRRQFRAFMGSFYFVKLKLTDSQLITIQRDNHKKCINKTQQASRPLKFFKHKVQKKIPRVDITVLLPYTPS